jgi:hypothetical protein
MLDLIAISLVYVETRRREKQGSVDGSDGDGGRGDDGGC